MIKTIEHMMVSYPYMLLMLVSGALLFAGIIGIMNSQPFNMLVSAGCVFFYMSILKTPARVFSESPAFTTLLILTGILVSLLFFKTLRPAVDDFKELLLPLQIDKSTKRNRQNR